MNSLIQMYLQMLCVIVLFLDFVIALYHLATTMYYNPYCLRTGNGRERASQGHRPKVPQ